MINAIFWRFFQLKEKLYILVFKFQDNLSQWLISRKCKTIGMTSWSSKRNIFALSLLFAKSQSYKINFVQSKSLNCPKFIVNVFCHLRWYKNSTTQNKEIGRQIFKDTLGKKFILKDWLKKRSFWLKKMFQKKNSFWNSILLPGSALKQTNKNLKGKNI